MVKSIKDLMDKVMEGYFENELYFKQAKIVQKRN